MTLFSFNVSGFVRRFISSEGPPSAPFGKVTPAEPPRPLSTAARNPSWGLFALAVILAAAFFEALQWPHIPRSIDTCYHMAVANGFRLAGGYVTHAFWEYAPAGRPHLYPPLLHCILLALRALGLSGLNSGRLIEVIAHPLTLWALWAAVRKFSGPAAAFFTVFLWASVYSVYAAAFDFPAETLAFILGLGAFAAFKNRNRLLSVIFLALAFYAHGLFSWIFLSTLLIYGVAVRRTREAVWITAAALLMALPLLIHQFSHAGSFHFEFVAEDTRFEINLTVAILAIAGIFLAYKKKISAAAPLCLLAACTPFVFIYSTRLTGGHGLVGAIWLAALAFEFVAAEIYSRRPVAGRIFLAAAAAWIVFASPTVVFDMSGARLEWETSTLSRQLLHPAVDARTAGLYSEKPVQEIVEAIRKNCEPDEIIWSNWNYAGALLSALSDRATSMAALREVRPDMVMDPVAAAKVAVCFRENDGSEPVWVAPFARKHGLERVAETTWAVIYKNPRPTPRVAIPHPSIASGIIFILLGTCGAIAVWSAKRQR